MTQPNNIVYAEVPNKSWADEPTRLVAITGPDAHPFRCTSCSSCYRQARFAERCCEQASEDLRSGYVRQFSAAFEEKCRQEDERQQQLWEAEHKYECSCGERYREVRHAARCGKCRHYTEVGYCTEVVDILTEEVVWRLSTI